MRYAYLDLGRQAAGSTATVRWTGAAADVLLLDPVNFVKYSEGRTPVMYSAGGHFRRPPARLAVPQDGHWYVVADLRGYSANAQATVELAQEESGQVQREEVLVEAG
jgi:hypothetical protein